MTLGLLVLSAWMLLTQPGFPLADRVYPSEAGVAAFFEHFATLDAPSAREEAVRDLLRILNFPQTPAQNRACDRAFEGLLAVYAESHDPAIASALDKSKVGGPFGERVCGLYRALSADARFLERLRAEPAGAVGLGRCEGIAFSREEIAGLVGGAH